MNRLALTALAAAAAIAAVQADDKPSSEKDHAPPKAVAKEAAADVPASPADARPIVVGAKAPGAKVVDAEGNEVELAAEFSGKTTLLIFYRGGWCPFCTAHLAQISSVRGELEKLGINIIAISPESSAHVKEYAGKGNLGYRLLGDPDGAALRAYGVAFRLDEATAAKYREYGVDLEERSGGRTHRMLPVPAAFLVDQAGTVRFAHSDPDYRKRVDPQALLDAAKSILVAQEPPPQN